MTVYFVSNVCPPPSPINISLPWQGATHSQAQAVFAPLPRPIPLVPFSNRKGTQHVTLSLFTLLFLVTLTDPPSMERVTQTQTLHNLLSLSLPLPL